MIHPFLPVFSIGDSLPHSQDGGGDMETRAYREDCNFLIHNLSLFPFFSIIYILISLHYYHSPIDKSYLSVPCRHFSRLSTSCVFGGDMMENERREWVGGGPSFVIPLSGLLGHRTRKGLREWDCRWWVSERSEREDSCRFTPSFHLLAPQHSRVDVRGSYIWKRKERSDRTKEEWMGLS